ncbi:MAG: VanZ family protein [Aristaeellaceae bacterium]
MNRSGWVFLHRQAVPGMRSGGADEVLMRTARCLHAGACIRACVSMWLLLMLGLLLLPSCAHAATSSNLSEQRIETADGYRVDYVDAQGVVTLATDKGYASVVRRVENDNPIEEYYLDENGQPVAVSGYYGKINLYDGDRLIRITYVDANRQPVRNSSGYAIIERTVDDAGHAIQDMYYDEAGQPVALSGGQYGLRRDTFDEQNRVTHFTYLGEDGEPVLLSSGYASVSRTYDEHGWVAVDMYWDLSGAPAVLSLGHSGSRYLRNESGRNMGVIYLDASGQPMVNNQGYGIVRYTYDEWNNIVRYAYYSLEDEPVALSRGQYAQVIEYNRKERVRSYYVDAQGHEIVMMDQFLSQQPLLNVLIAVLLVAGAVWLPKRGRVALLGGYILFIGYMTLFVRETGAQKMNLELFWSYKQLLSDQRLRVEIFHNVLLFVPLGALLYSLWPSLAAVLPALLLSGLIEAAQLVFGLGLCELDDVLSNTLGAMLGAGAYRLVKGAAGWIQRAYGSRRAEKR